MQRRALSLCASVARAMLLPRYTMYGSIRHRTPIVERAGSALAVQASVDAKVLLSAPCSGAQCMQIRRAVAGCETPCGEAAGNAGARYRSARHADTPRSGLSVRPTALACRVSMLDLGLVQRSRSYVLRITVFGPVAQDTKCQYRPLGHRLSRDVFCEYYPRFAYRLVLSINLEPSVKSAAHTQFSVSRKPPPPQ
jgi:hypothetical protein